MNVPTQAHCGRLFQLCVFHCDTLGEERGWGWGHTTLMDEVRPSSVVHRRLLAFVNLKAFLFLFFIFIPGAAVTTHASHIKM